MNIACACASSEWLCWPWPCGLRVFDELSDGQKKMDMYMKKKPGTAEAATATANRPKAPRATEYFANQKNARRRCTPGTVSTDIVGCKLKTGTQFMKATDCVSRGGVPAH